MYIMETLKGGKKHKKGGGEGVNWISKIKTFSTQHNQSENNEQK